MSVVGVKIAELPQLLTPQADDKIPVQHGQSTYKINYADLKGTGAVRYDEAQTLTDAQKQQARDNIGAGTGGGGTGAVRYDEAQTLTDAQKTTARGNIAAASADGVGALSSAMTYVVSGNKSIESVSIPVGAYVRLVGSTIAGRSDGIYTVATAIPVNTVIDGTYFNESAPIQGGGLNALNASLKPMIYDVVQTSSLAEVDLTLSGYTPVMMSLASWLGYKGFMRCDDHFPNKIYVFTDGYSSGTINHKLMVLYQKN